MARNQRSGFTLIELLVVIAIIAVLAAILFPVFAQAREKARQASCLSNAKQLGLGAMMYVEDYDETYPLAAGFCDSSCAGVPNTWLLGFDIAFPADWRPNFRERIPAYSQAWANSMQPYIKNYALFACPSGIPVQVPGPSWQASYAAPVKPWAASSYQFNGLLHGYPQAGAQYPSDLPLIWEGGGKAKLEGAVQANPVLNCPNPGACVYQSATPACSPLNETVNGASSQMGFANASLWVHSGGAEFVMADGHAKWRRLGAHFWPGTDAFNGPFPPDQGDTDYRVDPNYGYDANGIAEYYWTATPTHCHPCLFAPDHNPADACYSF